MYMEKLKFNELGFNKNILDAIDAMGFEEPSQIQAEAIPEVLKGNDIIGQAQTGTGKTMAFGAPILNNITPGKKVKALVLAPTRELAIQVNEELMRIAKFSRMSVLPIYGGQPIDRQIKALRRGIDIVVGTPGRVIDHINRKTLDLSEIEFLVLDEADEMLNMGFIDDIEEIIKSSNEERQTLLFSATMPDQIKRLAKRYMKKDAKHIAIAKNTVTVAKIQQFYFEIKHKDRFETLCRILDVDEPSSAIIFCKTKRGVDELVEWMQGRGYNVEGMHGDMNQSQRMNTLRRFKEGNLDFLVATDVAARGIDVEDITHVINYDLPQDTESYVHRIGRTGRANKEGTAYSLVTPREYIMLKQIEKYTKSKIKRKEIPTIDEIFESKYKSIINTVKESLDSEDYKDFIPVATELDEEYNLVDVAAALMKMYFTKELSFDYKDNALSSGSKNVRLFLSIGKIDKIDAKKLLKFIAENSGLDVGDIGDIDILTKFSFIDVPERFVDVLLKKVNGKRHNGRRVNIEIAQGKTK
jgi:ATP-dependent RNA helicase DeaD